MADPTVRDWERAKRIGRYLSGKPRAKCWLRWQQSGDLEAYSDADWGRDPPTRRSVSAGVIMRGGHCSNWWVSDESELYAAVKAESKGPGIQSVAKYLGLDASESMGLVNRRGLGKAKHVDMQNLWIQEASKSGRFATKKVGTNVNPADLMTKPLLRPKIKQLMKIIGYDFVEHHLKRDGSRGARVVNSRQYAEPSPNTMSQMIGGAAASRLGEPSRVRALGILDGRAHGRRGTCRVGRQQAARRLEGGRSEGSLL